MIRERQTDRPKREKGSWVELALVWFNRAANAWLLVFLLALAGIISGGGGLDI